MEVSLSQGLLVSCKLFTTNMSTFTDMPTVSLITEVDVKMRHNHR